MHIILYLIPLIIDVQCFANKVPLRFCMCRFINPNPLWFVNDCSQVTFPNGVFSGTIISSVIKDGDLKHTAEWQLLLGAIALPGVFVGARLCNPLGRRNTVRFLSFFRNFQFCPDRFLIFNYYR